MDMRHGRLADHSPATPLKGLIVNGGGATGGFKAIPAAA